MISKDKRNYRIHTDENKDLIKKSLLECGAGRSILLDNENSIIAGNGVFEQAEELNIPVRIIETNGEELIAVKRTDLSTDDEKRRKLAVFDNSTSDTSFFDYELLQLDFNIDDLPDFGVTPPEIDGMTTDLPDINSGDKEPFQQMTFTLADEQAEFIKSILEKVKNNCDSVETYGNTNTNGNSLFYVFMSFSNER